MHPGPRLRPFGRLLVAFALGTGALAPAPARGEGGSDDMIGTEPTLAPTTRSALEWSGGASLETVRATGPVDLKVHLSVKNPSERAVWITNADLYAVGDGGWLTPLEDILRGRLEVSPGSDRFIAEGMPYSSVPGPASHVLLSGRADDGHSEFVMPLVGRSAEPPEAYEPSYPLGLGVARPLEVLPYADGRSSVVVLGQVQCLSGARVEEVRLEAILADGTGAFEPESWTGLGSQEDRKRIWPFVRRLDVPEGFRGGNLRISVSATVDGQPATYANEWPVEVGTPVAVQAPVIGTWHLVNGPGQKGLHANYRNPLWRMSYDFIVVEQGSTYRGPPHRKESYFAWNRSVKAVADGKVIDACDREEDNPGLGLAARPKTECQVNRVVVEHEDGVRTVYYHLRQFSLQQGVRPGNVVKAGQVLAFVGNSGDSMEPHLHLVAYRLDKTGRPRPVALTFTNAYEDAARQSPMRGVPVGGRTIHFAER